MRKYLKPALEIEAFDVEAVFTLSTAPGTGDNTTANPDWAAAPIDLIELN